MGNFCSCGRPETDRPGSTRRPVRRGHSHPHGVGAAGGGVPGLHGVDELADDDFPYQNQFTFSSLFPYLDSVNVRWDVEHSTWNYSQLKKKRLEFWDTRIVGNAEMWCALRLSVEMINQLDEKVKNGETVAPTERTEQLATCEAILESAALTKFSLNNSEKNTLHCYDRLGVKYDLPFFVFVLPKNLLKDDGENEKVGNPIDNKDNLEQPAAIEADDEKKREAHGSVVASTTQVAVNEVSAVDAAAVSASSTAPVGGPKLEDKEKIGDTAPKESSAAVDPAAKDKAGRDPNQLKLKFRFSNGLADCSAYFPVRSTIGDMKKYLEKEKKVAADKQLILFQGKRYPDQQALANTPFKNGILLQVLVRG